MHKTVYVLIFKVKFKQPHPLSCQKKNLIDNNLYLSHIQAILIDVRYYFGNITKNAQFLNVYFVNI